MTVAEKSAIEVLAAQIAEMHSQLDALLSQKSDPALLKAQAGELKLAQGLSPAKARAAAKPRSTRKYSTPAIPQGEPQDWFVTVAGSRKIGHTFDYVNKRGQKSTWTVVGTSSKVTRKGKKGQYVSARKVG